MTDERRSHIVNQLQGLILMLGPEDFQTVAVLKMAQISIERKLEAEFLEIMRSFGEAVEKMRAG